MPLGRGVGTDIREYWHRVDGPACPVHGREKDVAGRGLRAEVAWRTKDQVGLRFTGRPHEVAETMAGLLPWAVLDPALYY